MNTEGSFTELSSSSTLISDEKAHFRLKIPLYKNPVFTYFLGFPQVFLVENAVVQEQTADDFDIVKQKPAILETRIFGYFSSSWLIANNVKQFVPDFSPSQSDARFAYCYYNTYHPRVTAATARNTWLWLWSSADTIWWHAARIIGSPLFDELLLCSVKKFLFTPNSYRMVEAISWSSRCLVSHVGNTHCGSASFTKKRQIWIYRLWDAARRTALHQASWNKSNLHFVITKVCGPSVAENRELHVASADWASSTPSVVFL